MPATRASARLSVLSLGVLATIGTAAAPATRAAFWGEAGHRITATAAAARLPEQMPQFFRDAGSQLAYLNPEPDRWRQRVESASDAALDGGTAPDHFLDLELIPVTRRAGALAAKDRYAYFDSLRASGVDPAVAGVVPFRILELTQRLRIEFRLWRRAPNDRERGWIESRIINDAGILGHYVADASNPMHTSIHYNGWVGANPGGYATDRGFHGRFESAYVQSRITNADVMPHVDRDAQVFSALRPAIVAYFMDTHSHIEQLYRIDKAATYNAETTAPANKEFAVARLAAGATMLRDLWWTAWVTSATDSTSR
jgi:hypothetical protein